MRLSAASSRPRSSSPRYLTEPSALPFAASRPIAASMVWLLPEPDSPTTATVSQRRTVRFTARTASTTPSGVLKRTCRPETWSSVSSPMPPTSMVPRVERVAQSVAEEVEREQRDDEEDRGEDQHPRRCLDRCRALRDEGAEAGQRLLHAEPEEREEALQQDDARHQDGDENDHRSDGVRDDMAADDRPRLEPHRLRRNHE